MNEITNWFRIIEYEYSLEKLTLLAKNLHTACKLKQSYVYFCHSEEDILHWFINCINIFNAYNNQYYRLRLGYEPVPMSTIEMATQLTLIPRYVRDVCREICRPMFDGSDLYIPKTSEIYDTSPMNPKSAIYVDEFLQSRVKASLRETDCEFVTIIKEQLEPMPLCGYHDGFFFSVAPVKEFRKEAMVTLQWAQPKLISLTPYVSDPVVVSNETPHRLQANVTLDKTKGVMTINGAGVWCEHARSLELSSFMNNIQRFPSEDTHSVTPKASRSKFKSKGKDKDQPVDHKET